MTTPEERHEAYVVGRSRGDDNTNYALAYGHKVRETPTHNDMPLWVRDDETLASEYASGWQEGVADATERYDDTDEES